MLRKLRDEGWRKNESMTSFESVSHGLRNAKPASSAKVGLHNAISKSSAPFLPVEQVDFGPPQRSIVASRRNLSTRHCDWCRMGRQVLLPLRWLHRQLALVVQVISCKLSCK